MSSDWRLVSFQDLCDITRGASPRPIHDYLGDEGMPWIKIADATAEPSRFISSTKEKIKIHGVRASVEVFPGDLILSNSATPGLPKFMKINACIHDGWMLLRNFKGLDKEYAYWLLLCERVKLVAQGNGSVFTNLKTDILKSHVVKIPPIKVQVAIANALNLLDDRITLLRETNATLEAIAQALFKSWFVDFDPVRANIAAKNAPEGAAQGSTSAAQDTTAGIPEAGQRREQLPPMPAAALDAATAALFPDSFEDSELGLVPREWQRLAFTETVKIIGGGTPKTSVPEYWDGDIPWFSVIDAPAITDVFVIDTSKHISLAGLNGSSTRLLPEGTTIISARGTVGRLALVGKEMAMNQSCYGLQGKAGDSYFTYFSTSRLVEALKQRSHGSVFDTIITETMKGVQIIYPSANVIEAFEAFLLPCMLRIKENLQQSQTLTQLRNTLLPRLISGQLRLPDAMEAIADTLPRK